MLKINFEIIRLAIYCLLRICLRFLNLLKAPVYYQTIALCFSPIVCTLQTFRFRDLSFGSEIEIPFPMICLFKYSSLISCFFCDKTTEVFFQLPRQTSIFFIMILKFIKDMVWLDGKRNKKIFYNITLIVSVQLHFLILIIQW